MHLANKNGYKIEYQKGGLEIYYHPSPFNGERWYSVYMEHGDPIRRDISSYDEAEDFLFEFLERYDTGDDEILRTIGSDISSPNINRAIDKEIRDVTGIDNSNKRPGMDQILKGGPISTKYFMRNMGLDKDNISKTFGKDMNYIRNLTDPKSGIF